MADSEHFGSVAFLRSAWDGRFDDATLGPKPAECRYELLRLALRQQRSSALFPICETGEEIERFVSELWSVMEIRDRDYILETYHSLPFHRRRLFAWLVDRYAIRSARALLGLRQWPSWLPLLGVTLGFVLAWIDVGKREWPAAAMAGVGYAAAIALAVLFRRPRTGIGGAASAVAFAQALIPRLLGTAGAGALLLLSGSELLKWIAGGRLAHVLACAGIAALATWAYLLLEMQHRLEPPAPFWALVRRAWEVWLLALAHSGLVVLVLRPAFEAVADRPRFDGVNLLAVTIAVFTTGLILNVIWAEEPITHPL